MNKMKKLLIILMLLLLVGCTSSFDDCYYKCRRIYYDNYQYEGSCESFAGSLSYLLTQNDSGMNYPCSKTNLSPLKICSHLSKILSNSNCHLIKLS